MMNEKNIFTARRRDIVEQQIENEVLIYDLGTDKMYCLNETSAQIYRLCNGENSIEEISRQLSAKLKNGVSEDLIWLAIEQLKQNNLLNDSADISTKFDSMSRREVVKKIGFASMVALPVVSSLVAPQASQAASTCQTCTVSLPLGDLCFIPQGCAGSNNLGLDATGCASNCRFCECIIPGGQRSCSTTCRAVSQY